MEDIGAIPDEELTVDDLLAIAAAHRDQRSSAAVYTYYVVFVSGFYTDGTGPRPNVLAVSIGSTGVVAMFKDVIAGTGGVVPNVEKFVEQSTLVHELGHAVGLVANGVATTSAHHDSAHGAHCTNPCQHQGGECYDQKDRRDGAGCERVQCLAAPPAYFGARPPVAQ